MWVCVHIHDTEQLYYTAPSNWHILIAGYFRSVNFRKEPSEIIFLHGDSGMCMHAQTVTVRMTTLTRVCACIRELCGWKGLSTPRT